ncbi:hypothetical protein [Leptolyngbya sp. FACHB-60]|uniref:hypothetical protein n=2 Tax=Cyanophyceae TaxID=3028117 RepID=UPI001684E1C2|nr:hypothetical protein [Leptolyngbya sp. FACHB-60]MBD1915553.1 hypothetical protein [Phormidium sp. FACHB-77]MBD2031863.1 hypothetical protein [Phormidium sp. FACHB-322]MBD2050613.1 hypothetical protein [Leptolyngbya sp. FACHB-60]
MAMRPLLSQSPRPLGHTSEQNRLGRLNRLLTFAIGFLATTFGASTATSLWAAPESLSVTQDTQGKQDAVIPSPPPLPTPPPEPISPDATGIIGLTPAPNDNIGVGHLRPVNLLSTNAMGTREGASWLRDVALPIYPNPDSAPWGWLINGWLVPNGAAPLAIGRDAAFSMVQTEQQIYTFPVLEIRPDGWFRFQYTPAGAAWAHTSHLEIGNRSLTVETWESSMQAASRLAFRRPGLAQPMRLAPSGTAPLQALVGSNSIIQPLDLEGDWLRVRVTQPAQGCAPLPGSSISEGWVRWRSDADIPLVWFSSTDCQ